MYDASDGQLIVQASRHTEVYADMGAHTVHDVLIREQVFDVPPQIWLPPSIL